MIVIFRYPTAGGQYREFLAPQTSSPEAESNLEVHVIMLTSE